MAIIVPALYVAFALGIAWWAFRTALLWFVPPGPIIAFERTVGKVVKVALVLGILYLVAGFGYVGFLAATR